ncbi:nuclear transport factor 2 family protein [uncultured Croceitalea sp.]|uniref:nuclear transport factor 2 family protein n=1 Tax=uncultured Croceitalea sp. TaxID=1798908 RepID=UPI00374F9F77
MSKMNIRSTFFILLFLGAFVSLSAQEKEASHQYETRFERIAQEQLDAYNAKDIDSFLKSYAEDVKVYRFPDRLLYQGKDKMRDTYKRMFETIPNLHCTLENRIVEQNVVIDKEKVQLGDKTIRATAIYVIKDFRIKEVYFIQ